MKNKTVTIYKSRAIGPTEFFFTTGHENPLTLDARNRRYFLCEGHKTARAVSKLTQGIAAVLPPNTKYPDR